jgi:hypothetical protein
MDMVFKFLVLCFLIIILALTARLEAIGLDAIHSAPPLPGILPSQKAKTKLMLAQDIDWPPYAYLAVPDEGEYVTAGFGNDFAMGMAELGDRECDFEVVVSQTTWSNCWGVGEIGKALMDGHYHGCMTYTHTAGERNRFVEFSNAIL